MGPVRPWSARSQSELASHLQVPGGDLQDPRSGEVCASASRHACLPMSKERAQVRTVSTWIPRCAPDVDGARQSRPAPVRVACGISVEAWLGLISAGSRVDGEPGNLLRFAVWVRAKRASLTVGVVGWVVWRLRDHVRMSVLGLVCRAAALGGSRPHSSHPRCCACWRLFAPRPSVSWSLVGSTAIGSRRSLILRR